MKKVRIIILFMTLLLGMFFFMPAKVFANSIFDGTADDWFNHISQSDYGIAYSEIFQVPGDFGTFREFGLLIVEEPSHEVEGYKFEYSRYLSSEYWNYFEPGLMSVLKYEIIGENFYANIKSGLESEYGEDFDGFLYWNFEEHYWQIEYYESSELDYYMQRVEDLEDEISLLEGEIQDLEDEISLLEGEISSLEDEISSLENQISLLENENSSLENQISLLEDEINSLENEKSLLENQISSLENEISSLEDEIQQLEEALDLEYDRGYNDGYEFGYNEGLLVENNDIDIIKWFVPLVVIIIVVGIIEPIILCKRRG